MTGQVLPYGTKLVCIKRLVGHAVPPEIWTVLRTEETITGPGYAVRHADRVRFIYAHRIGEYFEVLP